MLTIIIAITALLFGSKSGVQTRRSHWVATSVCFLVGNIVNV